MEFYKLNQISPANDFLDKGHFNLEENRSRSKRASIAVVLKLLESGNIQETSLLADARGNIIHIFSNKRKKEKTHNVKNCGFLKKNS